MVLANRTNELRSFARFCDGKASHSEAENVLRIQESEHYRRKSPEKSCRSPARTSGGRDARRAARARIAGEIAVRSC